MGGKLFWGIIGGGVLGAGLGYLGGNPGLGIPVGIGVGVIAAGIWHYRRSRGGASKLEIEEARRNEP